MGKDRKRRQVGTGMKARGTQQAAEVPSDLSANEGQVESLIQPILEAQDVALTPNRVEEEIVQILESSESALVADGPLENEAVLDPTDELETAMKKAAEEEVADVKFYAQTTDGQYAEVGEKLSEELRRSVYEDGKAVDPRTDLQPPCDGKTGAELAAEDHGQPGEKVFSDELLADCLIGEQPDGSYKAVVTIKEGYWNAITEWAESDGVTPEEFLSNIITQNIETYAMPAKGR